MTEIHPTDEELEALWADTIGEYGAVEGEEAVAPEYAEPDSATPGNVPPPEPAEPTLHNFSYTLDVTDTDLVWSYGAPLDTSPVRQYLIDRGYACTAVQAQMDETGRPTGIVTVWTDPIPPDIVVDIAGGDEASAEDTETPETYIADTDVVTIPEGYTYSGDITFAAEMLRDANDDVLTMIPVMDSEAAGSTSEQPYSLGWTPLAITVTASSLEGGTTPSFGMQYGGDDTGDTLSIRNGTITGTLSPDGSAIDEISGEDWAEYDGSRYTGLMATVVTWTDTAEGAIVAKPDEKRLDALWLYLEAHGVEVSQMTGKWNFATPDTAPTDPEITVYARQEIDADLTNAFVYAEIDNAARDAFTIEWNAAISTSTMTRKVQGQAATPGQQDRSAPYIFFQDTEPTGDVREQDVWWPDSPLPKKIFVNGVWVPLPSEFTLTNESSTSVGRNAEATTVRSTALGAGAFATGGEATALGAEADGSGSGGVSIGTRAKAQGNYSLAIGPYARASSVNGIAIGDTAIVPSTSPGSVAIGARKQVPESTPYTLVWGFKDIRQEQPYLLTGRTRYGLQSPDGTLRYISIDNDGMLLVDDVAQNVPTDGSIDTDQMADDAVTPDKLDRSYIETTKILSGSGFVDLASIAAGATGVGTITVTGAAAGDVALVSASSQIESGLVFKQAWVSDSNTVSFAITNITGSSINPSGRSWYARVIKS